MIGIALRHKEETLERIKNNGLGSTLDSKKRGGVSTSTTPVAKKNMDRRIITILNTLSDDLNALKGLQSIEEKVEFKKNVLIQKYAQSVEDYKHHSAAYELVTYFLIWLIDVGDIERAVPLADFAIDTGYDLPERFKRDLPTYVVEEIVKWAQVQFDDQASAEPYLGTVSDRLLNDVWFVDNVVVKTKLFKLQGQFFERSEQWKEALFYFEKCAEVNPDGHGVKTRLDRARKKVADSVPPNHTSQQASSTDVKSD